jgi:hypothetical protein
MSLQVRVIKSSNVPIIDLSGRVDPYIAVTTGHEYHWHNGTVKTRVCPRNRNPFWDQTFIFPVKDIRKDVLQITLWDSGTFGDNMIGQSSYPLQNLPLEVEQLIHIPLLKAGKPQAVVEVGLRAIGFGLPPVTLTQTTYETVPTAFIQQPPQQQFIQPQQFIQQPTQPQQFIYSSPSGASLIASPSMMGGYEQNNNYVVYNNNGMPPGVGVQYVPHQVMYRSLSVYWLQWLININSTSSFLYITLVWYILHPHTRRYSIIINHIVIILFITSHH